MTHLSNDAHQQQTAFLSAVALCVAVLALMLVSCRARSGGQAAATVEQLADESLPPVPDYGDSTQWHTTKRQGLADIFYVISTETGDYTAADGALCHYADTYADSLRQPMTAEMVGVDTLLSGDLSFYAPYYRQCSLQTFTADSLAEARMPLPMADVQRAFSHYLSHLNQGRPFILAGFSQGALIALQLLRQMDDATYSRMVAAYLIGISIAQEELDADGGRRIRPAQRADDVGVTICYNSAREADCALWPRSAVAINPVGWRTDQRAGTLVTEPSPLVPLDRQRPDTLTVSLDSASHLLLVSGYSATDYVLPLIGREGNYHSREIWLYRHELRRNMARRVAAFLQRRMK